MSNLKTTKNGHDCHPQIFSYNIKESRVRVKLGPISEEIGKQIFPLRQSPNK